MFEWFQGIRIDGSLSYIFANITGGWMGSPFVPLDLIHSSNLESVEIKKKVAVFFIKFLRPNMKLMLPVKPLHLTLFWNILFFWYERGEKFYFLIFFSPHLFPRNKYLKITTTRIPTFFILIPLYTRRDIFAVSLIFSGSLIFLDPSSRQAVLTLIN